MLGRCNTIWLTWSRLPVVADAIDYVMRYFGILWNGKYIVAGARNWVSDKKHSMSLSLQKWNCLLTNKPSPVPAVTVFGVKIPGHGYNSTPKPQGLPKPLPVGDQIQLMQKLWLSSQDDALQGENTLPALLKNTLLNTVCEIFHKKVC